MKQQIHFEAIEDRLAVIERQNRTMKRILLSVVLVASVGIAMGAAHHAGCSYTAREFILVDECNTPRAKLHLIDGQPELTFYRKGNDQPQVRLGITACHNDSGELVIGDSSGTSLVFGYAQSNSALLQVLSDGKSAEIRVP